MAQRKLKTVISSYKRRLINKASKKGMYENFGQSEVRKLEDIYIDSSDYSDEMNNNRKFIEDFSEWCMTYNI